MTQQDRFGELRSLLGRRPSSELWKELRASLLEMSLDPRFHEVILPYVEDRLASWDPALRVADRSWTLQRDLRGPRASVLGLARHLTIQDRRVTPRAVRVLVSNPCLSRLESLSLEDCNVGDDGAQAIAQATHMRSLRSLNLNCARVHDDGFYSLLQAPHLQDLSALDMSYDTVSRRGVGVALANAPMLASLEALRLRQTVMPASDVLAILTSPMFTKVRVLDLAGTMLHRECVDALLDWPGLEKLEFLDLSFTAVTSYARTILSTRLSPQVRAQMETWNT